MAEWWEELFSSAGWQSVQLGWTSVEDGVEQADRIERALMIEPASSVLDVPCGTGRIAIELASRGYHVTGVDFVDRFLDDGRRTAVERGIDVELVHGDARDLPVEGPFDAALCFWGSFGYFDDAGNLAQARTVARALRSGGRFLLDVPTVESVAARFRPRNWFVVEETTVVMETTFAVGTSRAETEWTFLREGEPREVRRSSTRLYTVHELTDLLREAGFVAFEARDDALGEFTLGSDRLWLVATKGE
jgi:SAM-dependent methyltransferase